MPSAIHYSALVPSSCVGASYRTARLPRACAIGLSARGGVGSAGSSCGVPGTEVKLGIVRCQAVHELTEQGERRGYWTAWFLLAEQGPSEQTGYCAPEIARASPCRPRPESQVSQLGDWRVQANQPPFATDGKPEFRGGTVLPEVTPSEHWTPLVPC